MLRDDGIISDLLLSIHRAAREHGPEDIHDALLDLLRARLPFDSSTWGIGSLAADGLRVHSAHLYRELPTRYLGYDEVKSEDTVAFAAVRHGGRTLNLHLRTLYASPTKRGIREYARRVRHENELVTAHDVRPGLPTRWLALFRADPDDPFDKRERELCEILVPHLMEAVAANRALHAAALARPRLPRPPTALAGYDGFLLHAEPAFMELLRKEWPRSTPARLPAALARALAPGTAATYSGRYVAAQFSRWRDFAIVRLRERHSTGELTQREREIVRHIAAGQDHRRIAAALGLSPATVRNRIQRLHEKLGVPNNAALAARAPDLL